MSRIPKNPVIKTSIERSLSPNQVIPKLQRQLERLEDISKKYYYDPEVAAWVSTTSNLLNMAFGQPNGELHPTSDAVINAFEGMFYVGMSEANKQQNFKEQQETRKAAMKAAIEQLMDQAEIDGSPLDAEEDTGIAALVNLYKILNRFHRMVIQLRHRYGDRPTLDVNDEYDVQDLLRALLQIDFDDVRQEEHGPSSAGVNPRMDFLLKKEKIVLELKKTRQGLADKQLGDELIVDIARYQNHPDCKILVCFIYDPEHRVKNAAALKDDLKRIGAPKLQVEVIVGR